MVSIIVPAYNAEKFLAPAVASVFSQSDPDWELLLVDDGSTDGTGALCDRYASADPRVHAFHKSNGGLSDARNYGLDRAAGDFVAFLDADDMLHPEFISHLLGLIRETGAGMAAAPYVKFSDAADPFAAESGVRGDGSIAVVTADEALKSAMYRRRGGNGCHSVDNSAWGKIYKMEMWSDLRFTSGIWYEDIDIFYRLWPCAGSVALTSRPLFGYRQHPASFLHKFSPGRLDVLDVTDRMVAALEGTSLIRAARTRRFAAYCNILTLIYSSDVRLPEAEARCLSLVRRERGMVLHNREARTKDRAGAMLAYLPTCILKNILPILNRKCL